MLEQDVIGAQVGPLQDLKQMPCALSYNRTGRSRDPKLLGGCCDVRVINAPTLLESVLCLT